MEIVHGGDIYSFNRKMLDFSANISPLGIPEEIKKAIQISYQFADIYPDTQYRELRRQIADIELIQEENIICGNGAAEILFNIVLALKPEKVLLICPSFAEYEKAVDTINCEKIYYMLEEENDFKITSDYIDMINDDIDMLFICQPNNPTGNLTDASLMEKIIEKCVQTNTFIIIDECFIDFIKNGKSFSSVKLIAEYNNMLILKAFTKMFAIPGIRLGYGICSNKGVLEEIYSVRQPWNVSYTADMAGRAACGTHNIVVDETVKYIEHEKKYILAELNRLKIKYFKPDANYIFFKAKYTLKEEMAEKGILIRDCSNYRGLNSGYYRIAVKKHSENIRLIKALEECIWQSL